MKEKKYFCYEIFKNISVWSRNGRLEFNPCSFYKGHYHQSDTLDISAAWNSDGRKKLLDMIENDTAIPGCETCYRSEQHGLTSRRIGARELYEGYHNDSNIEIESPQGLDYSVGNLCNLKCVICGPHNSTQWIPDHKKLYPLQDISSLKFEKHNQLTLVDKKALVNIKNLHFHGGGDPLLSDFHRQLLKDIDEAKGLQDTRVFYNINGTTKVDRELLDLWEKCRLIELYFSIDDIGERFEYQRTNANWQQVCENLTWYKENMPHNHLFNINCTWSYLNTFYLDELYDWYESFFQTNRYGDPVNLIFQKAMGTYALHHVDQCTADKLLDKFAHRPELMKLIKSLKISNHTHSDFWININKLDSVRNTEFRRVFPEWSQLIS